MSLQQTILSIVSVCLLSVPAQAAKTIIEWQSDIKMSQAEEESVEAFLQEIEDVLPPQMKDRLTLSLPYKNGEFDPNTYKSVLVKFVDFGLGQIQAPNCQADTVDSMEKAIKVSQKYRGASQQLQRQIRYHNQIHTEVVNGEIHINKAFLPLIFEGPSGAETFTCGHKNTYQLAKAAVVHGLARLYDDEKYTSLEKKEYVENGTCSSYKGLAFKTKNGKARKSSEKKRPNWDESLLWCVDDQESNTLVSERWRYKTLAGGWADDSVGKWYKKEKVITKKKAAFWPRAVDPYAYAGDVKTHFAYNMEFFILDPTYQCRKPVLFEYLSGVLADKGKAFDFYQSRKNGTCQINTEVRVTKTLPNFDNKEAQIRLKTYDLDPNRIYGVYYFLAAEGDAIASVFGHSMFRLVGCPPAGENTPDCWKHQREDIILNHRANSRELQLDQVKGIFGGYPSQLFLSEFKEIYSEYGTTDLRHLYSIPVGHTDENGQFINQMLPGEKERFIYSALEQYWGYMGDYTFFSNNCADEALRLYQNASLDIQVAQLDITQPRSIIKELEKRGYVDSEKIKGIKEPNVFRRFMSKIPGLGSLFDEKADEYNRNRELVEDNDRVDKSRKYKFHDSVAFFMELDGENIYDDEGKINNPRKLKKEANKWLDLTTISDSGKNLCKMKSLVLSEEDKANVLDRTFGEVKRRYEEYMNKAKTIEEQRAVNINFYVLLYHMRLHRMGEIGEVAVQAAYEMAMPKNGRPAKKCKNRKTGKEMDWMILKDSTNETEREEKLATIKGAIESYTEIQNQSMTYSPKSVLAGYGIPLKSEVILGNEFLELKIKEFEALYTLIDIVGPELGVDYELLTGMNSLSKKVIVDDDMLLCLGRENPKAECEAAHKKAVCLINAKSNLDRRKACE